MFAARRLRQLAGTPPQRSSTSAPASPQPGHQNVDFKPLHGDVFPSRASLTVNVQRNVVHSKTNSMDNKVEKKYAGPTFHNSPAPETLPIPVFAAARSAGNSPIEKLPPVAPFFAEAASPQLNSSRPLPLQAPAPAPGWYGHYSMPAAMHYGVPETMATSSYPNHMSGPYNGDQLMEISQNLRMLLKIQSQ
ncbi:hypothetical protein BGX31_009677 [Mortierella sp. GBA43]|nr:hypothetical protein BGX31_009677 [Mortierella sp. GBA43]